MSNKVEYIHGDFLFWIKPVGSETLDLSLAGLELSFFIRACMMLHFGFVATTVLATHQYFGVCWTVFTQCQDFFFFSHSVPCSSSQLGVGKTLGGDIAGTAKSDWPKGYFILYDTMLTNTNWVRGRRRVGHFVFQGVYCLETVYMLVCVQRVVHDFLYSTCIFVCWLFVFFSPHTFLHILICLYLKSWVFSLLFFLFSPPILLNGKVWASGCVEARLLADISPSQCYWITHHL